MEGVTAGTDGVGGNKKVAAACDVEELKKCLEENKGNYAKCQSQIEAFKSSCSIKKPSPSSAAEPKTTA